MQRYWKYICIRRELKNICSRGSVDADRASFAWRREKPCQTKTFTVFIDEQDQVLSVERVDVEQQSWTLTGPEAQGDVFFSQCDTRADGWGHGAAVSALLIWVLDDVGDGCCGLKAGRKFWRKKKNNNPSYGVDWNPARMCSQTVMIEIHKGLHLHLFIPVQEHTSHECTVWNVCTAFSISKSWRFFLILHIICSSLWGFSSHHWTILMIPLYIHTVK